MTKQSISKHSQEWMINLALSIGGVLLALLLAQGIITLFPGLLPRFLRPNPYDRRRSHPDDIEIAYTVSHGDLFIAQQGSIAPPPNPDEALSNFVLSFDEDGFRRPIMEAEHYPIITLGDSFTDDGHVPVPWPDVLAAELDIPVQNMGFQGYGPQDYVATMNRYGTREPHEWVVIGFFEGNDLPYAIVDEESALTLPQVARQAFLAARGSYTTPDYGQGPWKYPIDMQLGNRTIPLNLFEFYLWFLNGELDVYENSLELAALGEQLASIQVDAKDACVLLAYFPDKSHIYFPYIADPADQSSVLSSAWQLTLDERARLHAVPTPTTTEQLIGRLDNQSIAIGNLATHIGIHFVDVSIPMKQAAARGKELYYIYDTHWNPYGHELAGQTIADYIRSHPNCRP
ncbi:MAG: hypothetical protein JXB07_12810 [Anaerolineae bacterium]|nr:hypothetical protein [Anaerolineae bacterium]